MTGNTRTPADPRSRARGAEDGGTRTEHLSAPSGTRATQATIQATRASFGLAADATLPCTPAVAGVDSQVALKQNATVNVTFFSLPEEVTAETFVLFKLVNYAFGTAVTSSTGFVRVPPCSSATIPMGSDSCVLSQEPYGCDGVNVTMRVAPSGDPGFSG